ncbi:WD40 repeat domain-containing protein [Micromonospora sp. 067-2]|uniref:WD40 repeat domain-containing protein n=1 Tax=Micromonospora sp. 067-2 TaxID=2789270 RepID=UPI00397C3F11
MIVKLPLDSQLWDGLSACYSTANAIARLREVVSARRLGEPWRELCDELLHQGSVYGVTSAAIPHLVDLALDLSADARRELWIQIGFMVTAGAGHFESPPAPGLQEGLTAALRKADVLAVEDFLADATVSPDEAGYFALACVAFTGHSVGRALWEFLSPGAGYVRMVCAGCDAEYDVGGFADPLQRPCLPPVVDLPPIGLEPWQNVARAIDDVDLGQGWSGFLDSARHVAAAGVPAHVPADAVWCLVAAMVATTGGDAVPWARTLARLAGHTRCVDCGLVYSIADLIDERGDAGPIDPASVPAETLADGVTGFRPAPGRVPTSATLGARVRWRVASGPVDALAALGDRAVLAAGPAGTTAWEIVSGGPALPAMPGPAVSVCVPDDAVIVTATPDGTLRRWEASTAKPIGHLVRRGGTPVRSLAAVVVPDDLDQRAVSWLSQLRGRRVLAVGDAGGGVELWEPLAGRPHVELFRHGNRSVVDLTALDFVDQWPWKGSDLIVLYGDTVVDVWGSAAVHGDRSTMAPGSASLAAIGHEHIIGAVVAPRRLGHRAPVLLADRNGTVSMWETFGVRLNDPLPPDPQHRDVIGIAAVPFDRSIAVVTVSRTDRTLRIWDLVSGSATLVPLDVHPRCVTVVGDTIVIGHDAGLLAVGVEATPLST